MTELLVAADRFSAQLNENPRATPHALHNMLVAAIGEESILSDILSRFSPDIRALPPDKLQQLAEQLKYYLGYNNSVIAEKLGFSRTTLWRAQKQGDDQ
ncbi:MAG: hypothetical protein ACOX81_09535 [Candidatus Heteroscillospira sp.]|jgi:hypothetical protein